MDDGSWECFHVSDNFIEFCCVSMIRGGGKEEGTAEETRNLRHCGNGQWVYNHHRFKYISRRRDIIISFNNYLTSQLKTPPTNPTQIDQIFCDPFFLISKTSFFLLDVEVDEGEKCAQCSKILQVSRYERTCP
jgi:hypothetical protein